MALKSFHQLILDEYFEPTIGKAIRVTIAFVLPLIWGFMTDYIDAAVWIAITAQILCNVNIQGSYPVKMLLLSGAVLACCVCTAFGTLAGHHWLLAAGLMFILAFLGGFVRQSGSHGPGVTIGVLLLYLLSLDHPGDLVMVGKMFVWILTGGILALVFTLVSWAFVPFNPFRHSIANTWKALSDWLDVFSKNVSHTEEPKTAPGDLDEKELALRVELNKSMEMLSRNQAIAHSRQNRISYQLVELRRIASFAGTTVSSLSAVTEGNPSSHKLFKYVLENLSQSAYRIALSIITNRPEDIYAVRLSMERTKQSINAFLEEVYEMPVHPPEKPLQQALQDMVSYLEEALSILERFRRQNANMTFYLRNFFTGMTIPQKIPWVRFEFNSRSFTFRFAVRLALAMSMGIGIYKYFHIPHGYWIAMTVMIVLQPEFGATIKKALDRLKGTISGAVFGSLLFLIPMPFWMNVSIVALCSLLMTFYLLRNYAIAAFFITIMVIALFHLLEPVTWQLGGIRFLNTLGGAGLALLGGFAFFPLWERYRFPELIKQAIEANKNYTDMLLHTLVEGSKKNRMYFVKTRREAEMNNNNAFHSLKRMKEEPEQKQSNRQLFFIIAGHNIRITRLLNALNQQITNSAYEHIPWPEIRDYQDQIERLLECIATVFETNNSVKKNELPPADEAVKKINSFLHDMSFSVKGDDRKIIAEILERITKEVLGLYYSIEKL